MHNNLMNVSSGRSVGTKFILGGGAETRCEGSNKNGGLPPGKFFMTTHFRSLENILFLENLPLKSLPRKILKFLTSITSKGVAFLIDSGSFFEYI